MYNLTLSYIASFIAITFILGGYFINKKSVYLICQGIGIFFLIISYLFISTYFAVVSMFVAMLRVIFFGIYELKGKTGPIFLSYLIVFLTLLSYVLVNIVFLKKFSWLDIMHLIAHSIYAFTFRMRNLTKMRFSLIFPNTLETIYNTILGAPIFTTLSYAIELVVVIIAIFKFDLPKETSKNKN